MFRLSTLAAAALFLFLSLASFAARHDNWVEVRSPNFVIVSNAGEKQTRKTALQFEQIREVFRQSLAVAGNHPSPLITVLAAKDEDTMRELLPEDWVKGHAHHAGLFVYRMNIYFAAVQLGQEGSNAYETFYHEYYHSLTVPYFPDLPLWVSEGLAEFYGHTQIDDKSVGMGQADAGLLAELRNERFIPLDVLFKVNYSSPYYNEAKKTSIFYAESWALTHYLMLGDRAAHRPQFAAYLKAVDQGMKPDEAAASAFGDVKKLQSDLLNYIHLASFFYMKVPAVAMVSDTELKARALSEAEADAYRGGFAAVYGHSDDAKRLLAEALRLDPNLALAHEYLGISQFFEGERDLALQSVSKAIDLDPNRAFTHFLRAELTIQGGAMMDQGSQVEADLRQAIALAPNLPPPYGLLAVDMAAHDENLPEALAFAQKAVSFEPASSIYQLALAQVLVRMDKYDEAALAVARARAWAREPQEKANAESFANFLQQARQYHSAAASGEAEVSVSASDESARTLDLADGTVTTATCQGGLKLELETDSGTLHLHEPLKGNIAVTVEGGAIPQFNLCSSLPGLHVEIRYSPDAAKPGSGMIRSMRVFAPNNEPELPPGTAIAEGEISSVTCRGNEMQLTLASADKSLLLHADDYTKIQYLAGSNSSLGDLDPCSGLKARSAKITFSVTPGKHFAGEMQTIVVGK